jgi:hypothetical protein
MTLQSGHRPTSSAGTLALLVLTWPTLAGASSIQVGAEAFGAIDAAIVAAADGDTILVPPGTWPVTATLAGRELTFVGTGGSAVTTLTSDGTAFDLDDSTITVEGVTIEAVGRAFDVTGGTLSARDVYVAGNASGQSGSVLFADGAIVDLARVRLADNGVSDLVDGGHIAVRNGADLRITDSVLTGGVARNGGILSASRSTVTIERSIFAGAAAVEDGGAIWASKSTLVVADSTFVDQSATQGADVFLDGGSATASSSTFARGYAEERGGAWPVDERGRGHGRVRGAEPETCPPRGPGDGVAASDAVQRAAAATEVRRTSPAGAGS